MSLTKVTYSMIEGQYLNAVDFGATGDGVTDDTNALNRAYNAAAASKQNLYIPAGNYRFTSQLMWNKNVSVYGQREYTNLKKDGNFDGIVITESASGCTFQNFNVFGETGNGGNGINIISCSYVNMINMFMYNHGQDGIYFDNTSTIGSAAYGTYHTRLVGISCHSNGRDGIGLNGAGGNPVGNVCNVCYFESVSLNANDRHGFHQYGNPAAGYHFIVNMTCEGNASVGFIIEGIAIVAGVYVESNGSQDVYLTTDTVRNLITVTNETKTYIDNGTNNTIMGPATGGILTQSISAPRNNQNVKGRDFVVSAASSISTSSGYTGGTLYLYGGSAGGVSSPAVGGHIYVQPGEPVGGEAYGAIKLCPAGGGVVVGSEAQGNTSTLMRFDSTTKAVQYVGMTTTQRNLLTAVDGMVIFNSSTSKLQVYTSGSGWMDLN